MDWGVCLYFLLYDPFKRCLASMSMQYPSYSHPPIQTLSFSKSLGISGTWSMWTAVNEHVQHLLGTSPHHPDTTLIRSDTSAGLWSVSLATGQNAVCHSASHLAMPKLMSLLASCRSIYPSPLSLRSICCHWVINTATGFDGLSRDSALYQGILEITDLTTPGQVGFCDTPMPLLRKPVW